MAKRKTTLEYKPPESWDIYTTYSDGVNVINEGETCKIKGETGTYTFRRFVVNNSIPNHGGWIDLFGGLNGHASFRSVKPEMLKIIPPKKVKGKQK